MLFPFLLAPSLGWHATGSCHLGRPLASARARLPVGCSVDANELRAAKAAASEAANAEARLRTMVREMQQIQDGLRQEVEDANAELEAQRILADEELEEMAEQLEAAEAAAAAAATAGGNDDTDTAELRLQLSQMTEEAKAAGMEATRLGLELQDVRAELEAVQALAAQDEETLRETIEEMTARVQRAEAGLSDADGEGGGAAAQAAAARVAELESQVAELLQMLDAQQVVGDELMRLRPRAARAEQLEAENRQLQQRLAAAEGAGVVDGSPDDDAI